MATNTNNTAASSTRYEVHQAREPRYTIDMVQLATFELHNPTLHPQEVPGGTKAIKDMVLEMEYDFYDRPAATTRTRPFDWEVLALRGDLVEDRAILLDVPWETLEQVLEATRPDLPLSDHLADLAFLIRDNRFYYDRMVRLAGGSVPGMPVPLAVTNRRADDEDPTQVHWHGSGRGGCLCAYEIDQVPAGHGFDDTFDYRAAYHDLRINIAYVREYDFDNGWSADDVGTVETIREFDSLLCEFTGASYQISRKVKANTACRTLARILAYGDAMIDIVLPLLNRRKADGSSAYGEDDLRLLAYAALVPITARGAGWFHGYELRSMDGVSIDYGCPVPACSRMLTIILWRLHGVVPYCGTRRDAVLSYMMALWVMAALRGSIETYSAFHSILEPDMRNDYRTQELVRHIAIGTLMNYPQWADEESEGRSHEVDVVMRDIRFTISPRDRTCLLKRADSMRRVILMPALHVGGNWLLTGIYNVTRGIVKTIAAARYVADPDFWSFGPKPMRVF